MKKLVCILLLCCLCIPALAEYIPVYQPLYQSPAASRAGETISTSMPRASVSLPESLSSFSIGVGRTFVYLQQGMLIVEHMAQAAGDYCLISCRAQNDMGQDVPEFLIEQFSAGGMPTLRAVYAWINNEWQLTILP